MSRVSKILLFGESGRAYDFLQKRHPLAKEWTPPLSPALPADGKSASMNDNAKEHNQPGDTLLSRISQGSIPLEQIHKDSINAPPQALDACEASNTSYGKSMAQPSLQCTPGLCSCLTQQCRYEERCLHTRTSQYVHSYSQSCEGADANFRTDSGTQRG